MQLRHLRYFVRIVEGGSFSRAAATIHVAQSPLSRQIASNSACSSFSGRVGKPPRQPYRWPNWENCR